MAYILGRKVYTDGQELGNCLLKIENRQIKELSTLAPDQEPPAETVVYDCLAPGFIDVHINGGETLHFTQSPTREALIDMASASRLTGTPFLLPTCITSPWENILGAIDATRAFMEEFPEAGVLGMHLEGPFLNPKKRGAHLERFIQKPTDNLLLELIEKGRGVLKIITVAPEYFSAEQLIRLQRAGIVVSAGHSNATYREAAYAFENGVGLCTHLYNAMSAFGHREPGLVGAVFDFPDVYAPIILDGIHCDFAAARVAYKQKGEKLFLISDALFLGKKKKTFQWEEFDASLIDDRYVNTEGNLSGGAVSLPEVLVNAVLEVKIPLAEAVAMCTLRPAKVLGLEDRIGRIAPGYPAVFTVFSDRLSNFGSVSF
ncbi:N-acetylglucosamine-6-phosphate deacetylase [Ravibacter arvi]|uniref:N-acetylglucosamine-6-phosphate deacetylase n=1 Tax=Ravibacter arvi TaxID=2051041 RepID=A0ABP8M6H7_9BACT